MRPVAPALCWGMSWSPLPQASCSAMTNGIFCPPSMPCAHRREGHVRLTYFGQWSEVEPQCCREAVDNLYSAPGKEGAFVWVNLVGEG